MIPIKSILIRMDPNSCYQHFKIFVMSGQCLQVILLVESNKSLHFAKVCLKSHKRQSIAKDMLVAKKG